MSAATDTEVTVSAFTMEADHHRNCDLLIQNIPNLRLRSRVEGTRPVIDAKTGKKMVPQDQSRSLAALPPIPGMQIKVIPDNGKVIVTDPLKDNDALCMDIKSFLIANTPHRPDVVEGAEKRIIDVDAHGMKTLLRELLCIIDSGDGKVIDGPKPDIEKIDEMPGRYLQNPGSQTPNTQPRYEDEMEEWVSNLSRTGG